MRRQLILMIVGLLLSLICEADTLRMVERATAVTLVPRKVKHESLGDLLVFLNPIFDSANLNRIGEDQGYCVRIAVGDFWQCTLSASLPDGQLLVTGPVHTNAPSTLTITGGSGKYVGAKGLLRISTRSADAFNYEFELQ